jgi:hypothetical protein
MVASPFFTDPAKSEIAPHQARDHPFFVRMNDADCDPAGIRGNHALIRRVSFFFKFDSKESQPITNPSADRWHIFSSAASEHQGVHSHV